MYTESHQIDLSLIYLLKHVTFLNQQFKHYPGISSIYSIKKKDKTWENVYEKINDRKNNQLSLSESNTLKV